MRGVRELMTENVEATGERAPLSDGEKGGEEAVPRETVRKE